jgi:hypothetical protein
MADMRGGSKRQLLLFTLIGFACGCGLVYSTADRDGAGTASLQQTISSLQIQLNAKELELERLRHSRSNGAVLEAVVRNVPNSATTKTHEESENLDEQVNDESIASSDALDGVMTLKDLETESDIDPRPFADKLKDFLADNVDAQKAAVASRGVFDMAKDRESLPDYALQSLYNKQSDPNLKRVIAQVLSQRGNNFLLDNQIAETQAQLKSDQAADRRAALNELAKIRSVKAVDVIVPYLQDPDTNVKLEALQALRETGNQSHVALIQTLVNDPDPAVSSLAAEVQSQLKNLSSTARATISSSDIEATLPPLPNS